MGWGAAIGLGLGGLSMALQIYGQKKQASSEKEQHVQNTRQHMINQILAREQAADAISRGGTGVAQVFGEADRQVSAQRASTAGRGFEIGVGTAQDITNATNLIASADAITIRYNAAAEARSSLIDAFNEGEAAKGSSVAARSTNARAGIASTLLSGASMLSSQWESRRLRNQTASYGRNAYPLYAPGN